jgi:aryl-alcohol dehydrogenase-like predicted oxidoreductase
MTPNVGNVTRLALGTAQFGMDYGITNSLGQTSLSEVRRILTGARTRGLDTIDTAIGYGESEAVLGSAGVKDWQVYTKLPEVPEAILENRPAIRRWVAEQMEKSLGRLRQPRVAGLMLHRPGQLVHRHGAALYDALCVERDSGRAGRIGVSVYGPEELSVLPAGMAWDVVQAPLNVLDMRLVTSGWLDRLVDNGCAFHARSVFLQGLLLLTAAERPVHFAPWAMLWQAWDRYLADTGLTRVEACLSHVLQFDSVERIVVGVNSMAQLTEIVDASEGEVLPVPDILRTQDMRLLNPSKWPTP